MPSPSEQRYYLRIDDHVTGPHSIAVLRQKADIYALDRESLIALEEAPQSYAPIHQHTELATVLFPPPRKLSLAPDRGIQVVNTHETIHAPSVREILLSNHKKQDPFVKPLTNADFVDRRTGRNRDYLIAAGVGNGVALLAFFLLPGGAVMFTFILAGVVIYNLSLAWLMFFVIDKY